MNDSLTASGCGNTIGDSIATIIMWIVLLGVCLALFTDFWDNIAKRRR